MLPVNHLCCSRTDRHETLKGQVDILRGKITGHESSSSTIRKSQLSELRKQYSMYNLDKANSIGTAYTLMAFKVSACIYNLTIS